MTPRSVAVWLLRGVWVAQPLVFVPLLGDAVENLPGVGRALVAVVAWAVWATGLLAALVPTSVTLTIGRLIAPATVAAVAVAAGGPVTGWMIALGAAAACLAVLTWFSGDVGVAFAQGSAYGDERRFPLKPPAPYLIPIVVSWLVLTASSTFAVVLLANERWVVGSALAALAVATATFVGPRFHQLSRRWLVVVPAGVVVHDPLLLVENVLFARTILSSLHLAPAGTQAADLTGGTPGMAVEVVLSDTETVILAGGRDKPNGNALHVLSVLVSPSRPGRALRAAAEHRHPVG